MIEVKLIRSQAESVPKLLTIQCTLPGDDVSQMCSSDLSRCILWLIHTVLEVTPAVYIIAGRSNKLVIIQKLKQITLGGRTI